MNTNTIEGMKCKCGMVFNGGERSEKDPKKPENWDTYQTVVYLLDVQSCPHCKVVAIPQRGVVQLGQDIKQSAA